MDRLLTGLLSQFEEEDFVALILLAALSIILLSVPPLGVDMIAVILYRKYIAHDYKEFE